MCNQCNIKPVYEFTNKRKLCKRCFIKYFQRKILYTIRKFGMTKNGDIIGYENKGNFREVVLEDSLKTFAEKAMVKLIKLNRLQSGKKMQKVNKIAVSSTIDSEANEIVSEIIKGNADRFDAFPAKGKIIKPLYLFLDEEVLLYAQLKNLKFEKIKGREDKISHFINSLEKKHPEVKRAVVKGYLEAF